MNSKSYLLLLYGYLLFFIGGFLIGSGLTILSTPYPEIHRRYFIVGFLKSAKGEYLGGMNVYLWGGGLDEVDSSVTDTYGMFAFDFLAVPGHWVNLVVRKGNTYFVGLYGSIILGNQQYIYLGEIIFDY